MLCLSVLRILIIMCISVLISELVYNEVYVWGSVLASELLYILMLCWINTNLKVYVSITMYIYILALLGI